MAHHSFAIVTLGCKVNQYESQKMREQLLGAGLCEIEPRGGPDLLIVNTCTVTHSADRKSRQKIRQAQRGNPDTLVLAAGCAAEGEDGALRKLFPGVRFISNRDKENILPFIPGSLPAPIGNEILHSKFSRTRALLKIQDGCDHFCSYCIVPYVRGRSRSRMPEDVVEEALKLKDEGYKEIVITGIHLGAYGLDRAGRGTLHELLATLSPLLEGVRIRISSIEPADFSPQLLEVMTEYENLCPHLHLPLQHASPPILERMNRGYAIDEYSRILGAITGKLHDAAITTDIIVGFPGESEKDFQLLFDFVQKSPFYRLHVFKFSPRRGTRAALFPDQVDDEVKQARSALLIEKGLEKTRAFSEKFIGKTLEVLAEGREKGVLYGLTPQYLKVSFKGDEKLQGTLVNVLVEGQDDTSLLGSLT
jgi:threonylcarbamoyladenosine tRNA methylthiotransferase MtaB